jgi:hypothetical protein
MIGPTNKEADMTKREFTDIQDYAIAEIVAFIESSHAMALDQQHDHDSLQDALDSYGQNARDTLNEWQVDVRFYEIQDALNVFDFSTL